MIHENSIAAYQQQRDSGRLSRRQRAIVEVLERDTMQHLGRTDRMLMNALGFTDPNAVRPRVTELVNMGFLEECGEIKDSATGMTVRRVRIKKTPQTQENMELF